MNSLSAEQLLALKELSEEQIRSLVLSLKESEAKHKDRIERKNKFNGIIENINKICPSKPNINYHRNLSEYNIGFQKLNSCKIDYIIVNPFSSFIQSSIYKLNGYSKYETNAYPVLPERVMMYKIFRSKYKKFCELVKIKKFKDLTEKELTDLCIESKDYNYSILNEAYILTLNQIVLLDTLIRNKVI